MSFLKSLFSFGASPQQARDDQPSLPFEELIDVRFSERNQDEAELQEHWNTYERALGFDREVAEEILTNFFEKFVHASAQWEPDELYSPLAYAYASLKAAAATGTNPATAATTNTFPRSSSASRLGGHLPGQAPTAAWKPPGSSPAAAAAAAASGAAAGSRGSVLVRVVEGCAGGHPRSVLQGLVGGLEKAPKRLSTVLLREDVSAQDLLRAGGLPLLHGLAVLLRSRHNRALLSSMGVLPALAETIRLLTQKLGTAVGVVAVQHSAGRVPPQPPPTSQQQQVQQQTALQHPEHNRNGHGHGSRAMGVRPRGPHPSTVHVAVLQELLLAALQAALTFVVRDRQYHEKYDQQYIIAELAASPRAAAAAAAAGRTSWEFAEEGHALGPAARERGVAAAGPARREAGETAAVPAEHAAPAEAAVHALVERGTLLRCLDICECLLRLRLHMGATPAGTGTGVGDAGAAFEATAGVSAALASAGSLPSTLAGPESIDGAGSRGCVPSITTELEQAALRLAAELLGNDRGAVRLLTSPSNHRQLEQLAGMLGWPASAASLTAPRTLGSVSRAQSSSLPGTPTRGPSMQHEGQAVPTEGLLDPGAAQRAQQEALSAAQQGQREGGLRAPGEELALQLLVLQAWLPILRASGCHVKRFQGLGGPARITQLLHWAALMFSPAGLGTSEAAAAHEGGVAASLSTAAEAAAAAATAAADGSFLKAAPGNSVEGAAVAELVACRAPSAEGQPVQQPEEKQKQQEEQQQQQQLDRVFGVLWDWVAGRQEATVLGAPSDDSRLLAVVLGCLLDAFRPAAAVAAAQLALRSKQHPQNSQQDPSQQHPLVHPLHDAILSFLCYQSTALQHCTLRFAHALLQPAQHSMRSMLSAEQLAVTHLEVLRQAGLWGVVFGPAFFSWCDANSSWEGDQAKQLQHSEQERLQRQILAVLRTAATLPSLDENEPEVDWLVRVLDSARLPSLYAEETAAPSASGMTAAEDEEGGVGPQGTQQQRLELPPVSAFAAELDSLPGVSQVPFEALAEAEGSLKEPREERKGAPPGVVVLVCSCLEQILQAAPATTAAAMSATDLLGVVTRLPTKAQRALAAAAASGAGAGAGARSRSASVGDTAGTAGADDGGTQPCQSAAEALRSARYAALSLLSAYLSADTQAQLRAVRLWDPVAVLFSAVWEGDAATCQLALSMVVMLMRTPPGVEDDRLAKAALFTKYVETLPHAVQSWRQHGTGMVSDLLRGMHSVVAANPPYHQDLFSQAQGLVQVANVLNEEYPREEGIQLCMQAVNTLGALVAGNEALRNKIGELIGYEVLLAVLLKRCTPGHPPQLLLRSVLGLILEEVPPPAVQSSGTRFSGCTIANAAAVPLYFHLLRHADRPDRLWGLAAWRELLLQGGTDNLIACDRAGLNSLLIGWVTFELQRNKASSSSSAQEGHSMAVLSTAGADDAGSLAAAGGSSIDGNSYSGVAAVAAQGEGRREHTGSSSGGWDEEVVDRLLGLLGLTGSYSITGRDLHALLSLLKPPPHATPALLPPYAVFLLRTLSSMAAHEGPPNFFNFMGGASHTPTGIPCQGQIKPPTRGYSLAAWLRVEGGRDAADEMSHQSMAAGSAGSAGPAGRTQRVVAALLSRQPDALRGLAFAVEGQQLVVHSWAPKHAELATACQLSLRRWCHLAITHSPGGALSQPLLKIYVDGALQASLARVRYPGPKEALNSVCFGAAAAPAVDDLVLLPFQGQMGAIFLFDDVLSPAQAHALWLLGPAYQSGLAPFESSAVLDQSPQAAAVLLQGRDAPMPRLLLNYNPQAADGRRLQDLAGGPPASLLPGTSPCCTRQPRDMLHCLGGMAVLLPLLALLDKAHAGPAGPAAPPPSDSTPGGLPQQQPAQQLGLGPGVGAGGDAVGGGGAEVAQQGRLPELGGAAAAEAVRLVAAMAEGCPANLQALRPAIMGFLLAQSGPRHLTHELLSALETLLTAVGPCEELLHDVLRYLVVNLRLWRTAPAEVQQHLVLVLLQLAQAEPVMLRRLLPIPTLLDHIRAHCGTWAPGSHKPLSATLAPAGDSLADLAQQGTPAGAAAAGGQVSSGGGGQQQLLSPRQGRLGTPLGTTARGAFTDPGAAAAEQAGELRKGYLSVVKALLNAAAGAPDDGGGDALQDPLRFLHDARALISFVGDCSDAALVEDVLSTLCALLRRESLARMPLLVCLQQLGGPALFLSLVSREQPTLRMLGLKLITACLDSMRGMEDPSHASAADILQGVGEGLLAFPLTPATRIALMEMTCCGTPWLEIDSGEPGAPPPRIVYPQGAALLLRLAAASENVAERSATLGMLCRLLEQPGGQQAQQAQRANLDMLASLTGWEQLLLDVMRSGAPSRRSTAGAAAAQQGQQDGSGALAYRLLLRLLCHVMQCVQEGASHLVTLAGLLRSQPGGRWNIPGGKRGGFSGGGQHRTGAGAREVLHAMVADVMAALLEAQNEDSAAEQPLSPSHQQQQQQSRRQSQALSRALTRSGSLPYRSTSDAEAWTVVSKWATQPYLSNAAALLWLAGDLWSNTLLPAPGTDSLWPSAAATAWAETQPPPDTIPSEVWSTLGAATTPAASHTTPDSLSGTTPLAVHEKLHPPPGLQWQPPLWQLLATWRFAGSLLGSSAQQEEAWGAAASPPLLPRGTPHQQQQQGRKPAAPGGAWMLEGGYLEGLKAELGMGAAPRLSTVALRLLSRMLLCTLRHGTAEQVDSALAHTSQLLCQLAATTLPDDSLTMQLQLLLASLTQTHKTLMAAAQQEQQAQQEGSAAGSAVPEVSLAAREAAVLRAMHAVVVAAPEAFPGAAELAIAGSTLSAGSSRSSSSGLSQPGQVQGRAPGSGEPTGIPSLSRSLRPSQSYATERSELLTARGPAAAASAVSPTPTPKLSVRTPPPAFMPAAAAAAASGSGAWPAPPMGTLGIPEMLRMLRPKAVLGAAAGEVLMMGQAAKDMDATWQALAGQLETSLLAEKEAVQAVRQTAREVLGMSVGADRLRRSAARQAAEEAQKSVARQWHDLHRSLTSERGLWANEEAPPAVHWKLDPAEDPSRRRLRLKRKYSFVRYEDPPRGTAGTAGAAPGMAREESMMELKKLVPGANPQALLETTLESEGESEEGETGDHHLGSPQDHLHQTSLPSGASTGGALNAALGPSESSTESSPGAVLQTGKAHTLSAGADSVGADAGSSADVGGTSSGAPLAPGSPHVSLPGSRPGSASTAIRETSGSPRSPRRETSSGGSGSGGISRAESSAGPSVHVSRTVSLALAAASGKLSATATAASGSSGTASRSTSIGTGRTLSTTMSRGSGKLGSPTAAAAGSPALTKLALGRTSTDSASLSPAAAAAGAAAAAAAAAAGEAVLLPQLQVSGTLSGGYAVSRSPLSSEAREAAAQQAMHDPAMHAYALPPAEEAERAQQALHNRRSIDLSAAGSEQNSITGEKPTASAEGPVVQPAVPASPALPPGKADDESAEDEPSVAAGHVLLSVPCQWVRPKHVVSGRLDITAHHLHFAGSIEDTEGASNGSSAENLRDWGAQQPQQQEQQRQQQRRSGRWPLSSLMEAHHSRYLLQPTALELFAADRTSHALFNFQSTQAMEEVAAQLQRQQPSLMIYDRRRKLEWAARLQARWERWELSNFDYLMSLNTLASRSYNDLNQYPVFPWVLADYSSPSLDLNDPASFRDLTKPIGALNEKRLGFFLDRFESLRHDPEIPPFHYGSHYSSAGTVLFYLLRLEPFTGMNRALQGGRFDHADRLFHSIAATWQNCLDSSSDVKELVPEFYSQPEFLRNANDFSLGLRQDGVRLGDVVLPPWANGSPDEFVRVMREALEGDVVSQNLHAWIDLIFGFKQRGRGAEEALNQFYYLTYEGTVDLDSIGDARQRRAVEEQIRHFGQTPMQLFKRRHPQRGAAPSPALRPLLNGPDVMRRSALGLPLPDRSGVAVEHLAVVEGRVVLVHADRAVSCHKWFPSKADIGAFTFSTGVMDAATCSIEPDGVPPRALGGTSAAAGIGGSAAAGAAGVPQQRQQQYLVLHGDRVLVSCGYWDGSLRCHAVEDGRPLQSLCYHRDVVTCLAATPDGRTLASGSRDTTIMLWEANPAYTKGPKGRPQLLPLVAKPRHVLYGHQHEVTCLALSAELDLVVSGAADGTLLVHTLLQGRYVRTLRLPGGASPPAPTSLLLAPSLGLLLAHSHSDLQLHALSINGRHLVSAPTHERLAVLAPSPDGRLVLTAGTNGVVTLRWLHSLQVVLRYDAGRGPLTALAVTPEDCFLAGTAEGSVVLFAPDPRRRITTRFNLADVRPAAAQLSTPPAAAVEHGPGQAVAGSD
ncbi:hypothetical protein N2152v2_002527 [Parachlorella kessleri]